MIRRVFLAAVLMTGGAVLFAAQNATFVLKNGERVSGILGYNGSYDVSLNVNGQERKFPWGEIAIIAFVPGDPLAAELRQVPESDNAPELERHLIVMRDGSIVRGKLYNISRDGGTITIDTTTRERRDISSNSIARIYLGGAAARSVYNSVLNPPPPAPLPPPSPAPRTPPPAVPTPGTGTTVNANQPWTDTGIIVSKGDRVSFNASGRIRIIEGSGSEATAGPDGSSGFPGKRTRYPVPTMAVGGLIGRVGNGSAFAIGTNTQPIAMPDGGHLFLGINDDNFADNSGSFIVSIVR